MMDTQSSSASWHEMHQPMDEEAPLHRSSSRLLRAASTTFTGGASLLPPAGEAPGATPSSQSLRRMSQSTVQQRMLEELWNRFKVFFLLCISLCVLVAIASSVVFVIAVIALIYCGGNPCDQPLNKYLITTFLVGQITPQVVKMVQRRPWVQSQTMTVAISLAGSIPGWVVIAWGMHMIRSSKVCDEDLYCSTKYFIYGQVVLFVFSTLVFSVGFTGVLAYCSSISDNRRPGCVEAIGELPRVPDNSPDLIDQEDNQIKDCPICWEPFSGKEVVVCTPCTHYFHEACLARWCKNQVDCPLCRALIGQASS